MCYLHFQYRLQELKLNLHQSENLKSHNIVFAPTKPTGSESRLLLLDLLE